MYDRGCCCWELMDCLKEVILSSSKYVCEDSGCCPRVQATTFVTAEESAACRAYLKTELDAFRNLRLAQGAKSASALFRRTVEFEERMDDFLCCNHKLLEGVVTPSSPWVVSRELASPPIEDACAT